MSTRRTRCIGRWGLVTLASVGWAVVMPHLLGCAGMGGNENMERQPAASAVRDPVLSDMPKPSGFRLDAERSVAIASGKLRLAKCIYIGSSSASTIKSFYGEYMPSAGFELRNWSLDGGTYKMNFESGREECTILIRPRDWNQTEVSVEVIPKAQGTTDRETPPPTRRPR